MSSNICSVHRAMTALYSENTVITETINKIATDPQRND